MTSEPPENREGPQDMPRFPEELIDSVKRTRVWQFANDQVQSEDQLSELLGLMYECSEDEFLLFTPEREAINRHVSAALDSNVLIVAESRRSYYVHPKFKRNYVRIQAGRAHWEWQREVLAGGNMLICHQLKLSAQALREFEMQQLIAMQKAASSNPIKLEPNFMGIGIDLKKSYAWLLARFAAKP